MQIDNWVVCFVKVINWISLSLKNLRFLDDEILN
jgi:hypothetical protein